MAAKILRNYQGCPHCDSRKMPCGCNKRESFWLVAAGAIVVMALVVAVLYLGAHLL